MTYYEHKNTLEHGKIHDRCEQRPLALAGICQIIAPKTAFWTLVWHISAILSDGLALKNRDNFLIYANFAFNYRETCR